MYSPTYTGHDDLTLSALSSDHMSRSEIRKKLYQYVTAFLKANFYHGFKPCLPTTQLNNKERTGSLKMLLAQRQQDSIFWCIAAGEGQR